MSDIKIMEKELDRIYSIPGLTLIYGPAGTGKSLLCLLAIKINMMKDPKGKIIYVDCQSSSFPYLRLKQIYGKDIENIKDKIFFVQPKDFYEQNRIIENISKIKEKLSIIIIDNATYLYRLEKGGYGKSYRTSKSLMKQIDTLAETAKSMNIPVIVSSHVYAVPRDIYKGYNVVGGKILESKAKCKIGLSNYRDKKKMVINSNGERSEYLFRINEQGIEQI